MAETFFFYDLETSGTDPRSDRIMQFAGQRTDMELKPIGEPYNVKVKLDEDVLPNPDAVLVTGITPQAVNSEGVSEIEFLKLFHQEAVKPGTIFVGFNNIRFDDEFIRHTLYRNFYDAYEWHWKDACSRWDMLDVVRMTRALRPEGIEWPFGSNGDASNRLELLTSVNKLEHENAHDALADVSATIAVAGLIKAKQPKLFDYLLNKRSKEAVKEIATSGQPFVYVSGRFSSEFEKLAVVASLGNHPVKSGCFVYDLRFDPTKYINLSKDELVALWHYPKDENDETLPVKVMQYNRCPAVAPLGVLLPAVAERLSIDLKSVQAHAKILADNPQFYERIVEASTQLDADFKQTLLLADEKTVEHELYDGFISDQDKRLMKQVHSTDTSQLQALADKFTDARLKGLLTLYKARNFPQSLSDEERQQWESYRRNFKNHFLGFSND